MMAEASNGAENLDMIELTLCRKCTDKDGGATRVKGLYCLLHLKKKHVPCLNCTSSVDLNDLGQIV